MALWRAVVKPTQSWGSGRLGTRSKVHMQEIENKAQSWCCVGLFVSQSLKAQHKQKEKEKNSA